MNIFIIPSWYPSPDHPVSGIFNKEQALALAENYPSVNFCVSLWGQKTENKLLWIKDHFLNLVKIYKFSKELKKRKKLSNNLFECYCPALTWTRWLFEGNVKSILKSNEVNLKWFEHVVGKVDVIHAHSVYPAGVIALALSERLGIPYLITEQITPFPSKHYLNLRGQIRINIRQAYNCAKYVITVSSASNNRLKNFGIKNSVCIPNLTNELFFEPSECKSIARRKSFFLLGRMVEQKGIDIFLKSISLIERKDVLFRIGGVGNKMFDYQNLARKLNLENVIWLGALSREEVKDELQHCSAFILPSLHENLPLVLLEAIACGKPVIATNCGGPEDIVNENNGILAKVGDFRDLAKKLSWMIDNYQTYDSNIIRRDFLDRFSSKVVTAQIIKIYKKTIEN